MVWKLYAENLQRYRLIASRLLLGCNSKRELLQTHVHVNFMYYFAVNNSHKICTEISGISYMRQMPVARERSSVKMKECLLDFTAHNALWDSPSRWILGWVKTWKLHKSIIFQYNTLRDYTRTCENTGTERKSCTAPFSPLPIKCQNTYWASAVTSEISEHRGGHGHETGRKAIGRSRILENLTPSLIKHPLLK
jgi:hypothetical protein